MVDGVVVAAHVIFVSALSPYPSFLFFLGTRLDLGACWDRGLNVGLFSKGLSVYSA